MINLKVKTSKVTGYTYLKAEKVKEAIDELQKRMNKLDTFNKLVVRRIIKRIER